MSKEPKRNVYVGHRYVPKVMGEWEKTETYEGLSIVTNKGTSYTSKKRVPKGIDILNEEYWVVTGNYNAQIEEYRKDVRELEKEVDKKADQTSLNEFKTNIDNQISSFKNNIDKDLTTFKEEINNDINIIEKSINEVYLNVKDYNVKGDGKTDDSIALQNVFDLAEINGGGNVFIPEGKYLISKNLFVGSNVHIIGAGRSTIIEGNNSEIGTNTAMFYNKGRENSGKYTGANNFSIQNLSLNSETETMQGIYTDNAKNYYFNRIWGLGKTKDHWFDINNSKSGIIENCYLIHGYNSDIQIDGRDGINNDLIIRNIYINNPNPSSNFETIKHAQAGIHFHTGDCYNIHISNVFFDGVDVGVWQDSGINIHNVILENFNLKNNIQPLSLLGGNDESGRSSENMTIRNWNVKSENMRYVIGYISGFNNLLIDNINVTTNYTSKRKRTSSTSGQAPLTINRSNQIAIDNITLKGDVDFEEDIYNEMIIATSNDINIKNSYSGKWIPKYADDTETIYKTQIGTFNRINDFVTLSGRIIITDKGSFNTFKITNLPYLVDKKDKDQRFIGSVGSSQFKDDIPLSISTGQEKDMLYLRKAGTDIVLGHDNAHETETILHFQITYKID